MGTTTSSTKSRNTDAAKQYAPKTCYGYSSSMNSTSKPSVAKTLGGKGYQLRKLVELKTPVPAFIIVPTNVYRKLIFDNPALKPLTQKSTGLISLGDLIEIKKLIREQVKFPSSTISEIKGFLELLPSGSSVSCRSSANCEDSTDASFAGQFDTYLNRINLDEVIEAVKLCYCSVWEKAVLDYREKFDLKQQIEMAVVVQLQVDSEVSGVAFTCNPLNNMRNEFVIETVYGQGEGLVSGEITPDKYIVNQDTNEIHLFAPVVKNEYYRLCVNNSNNNDNSNNITNGNGNRGIEKVEVIPLQKKYNPCLNTDQIMELSTYGKKLKEHYKCPVDIEFAIDSVTKELLLLQVRPVTTSKDSKPTGNPTLKWSYNLDQYEQKPSKTFLQLNKQWLRPLTPIYQEYIKSLNGATGGFRNMANYIPLLPDPYMAIVNGFVFIKMGKGEDAAKLPPSEWLIWLVGGLLFGSADKVIGKAFSEKTYLNEIDVWDNKVRREFDDKHREFANTDLTALDENELEDYVKGCLKHLEYGLRNHFIFLSGILFPPGALVEFCESITDAIPMKDILAIVSQPDDMFNHSPGKVMQEVVLNGYKTDTSETFRNQFVKDLRTLHAKVMNNTSEDPKDNEKLNDECTSFFKKYNAEKNAIGKGLKDWYDLTGHRLLGQYDMTTITAIETPTVMIADLLQCIDHKEHKDHELQRKQDAKKVRDKLPQTDEILKQFDMLLADALRCDRLRDERSLHGLLSAGGHCRRALMEVGSRYFKSSPKSVEEFEISDVLYIREGELNNVFEVKEKIMSNFPLLRRLVKRRKFSLTYTVMDAPANINGPAYPKPETNVDKTSLPANVAKGLRAVTVSTRMVGLDSVSKNHEPGDTELTGNAASNGEIIGKARVIKHTDQIGKIRKGDIVITPFTNSSFNVVMSLLGGIVTQGGGTLSHAGIISREMGIPCVTDVLNAVNVVPNGAKVKLDGTNGKLYILD